MTDYDYENFESEFLCPECGELLYVDTSTPRNDVCINQGCRLWPSDVLSILNPTEAEEPGIHRELQEAEKLLADEIRKWKPGRVANFAYRARKELITELFTKGIAPFEDFIAIGELLLMANKYPSEQTIDDVGSFRVLLERGRVFSRNVRNFEDVESGRIVFGRTGSGLKTLSIKYAGAVSEFQKEKGLAWANDLPMDDSFFPYDHLLKKVTGELNIAEMTDGSELLEHFWPLSLQLRYWLQGHYRTKVQYDYRPDLLDFTVLFGWHQQTWGSDGVNRIPTEKLEKDAQDLQDHFDEQASGEFSASGFLDTYIDSHELVPIAVRTDEGIVMDHRTLLLFLIYLQGCPDPEEPAIKKRGDVIQDKRAEVGELFEKWLREEVRSRGYSGPDTAIIVTYEYDILAISEESKTIIMADAKYRDMAPSSFTGANLINQELLGDGALRYEVERQQKRLDHFRDDPERFRGHLEPRRPWEEYNVRSFLVTKHTPLAHRYREVGILRAAEFLKVLD